MLLSGFQNFPAKCPKSKIFLAKPSDNPTEKNYKPHTQFRGSGTIHRARDRVSIEVEKTLSTLLAKIL